MNQNFNNIIQRGIDVLIGFGLALLFFIPIAIFLNVFCEKPKVEPNDKKYDTFVIKRDSLKTIVKELNNKENEAIKHIDNISNDSVYNLFKELVK